MPAIVSDVGGNREAIADGENGFVVPPRDSVELTNKLRLLIKDPKLRKKMGEKGRILYEQKFSFERMFRETNEIYNSILSKHKKI